MFKKIVQLSVQKDIPQKDIPQKDIPQKDISQKDISQKDIHRGIHKEVSQKHAKKIDSKGKIANV